MVSISVDLRTAPPPSPPRDCFTPGAEVCRPQTSVILQFVSAGPIGVSQHSRPHCVEKLLPSALPKIRFGNPQKHKVNILAQRVSQTSFGEHPLLPSRGSGERQPADNFLTWSQRLESFSGKCWIKLWNSESSQLQVSGIGQS